MHKEATTPRYAHGQNSSQKQLDHAAQATKVIETVHKRAAACKNTRA